MADEGASDPSPAYVLPGGDTGVIVRRGPEIAPVASTPVPRIDPVTRALEIAAAAQPKAPQQTTITSTTDRYVIVPQGWHGYDPYPPRAAGFSIVLKNDNLYLRLGDPPRPHRDRYWFPDPDRSGNRIVTGILR